MARIFGKSKSVIPRAHRIWTLSFGPWVGSDLWADREPSLGFDTAGPEAQPYHSIHSRKAKGRWYQAKSRSRCYRTFIKQVAVLQQVDRAVPAR